MYVSQRWMSDDHQFNALQSNPAIRPKHRETFVERTLPAEVEEQTLILHTVFGPYIVFPLVASLVWLAGLLALIALWVQDGKPQYSRGAAAAVVFISDVGGAHKVRTIQMNPGQTQHWYWFWDWDENRAGADCLCRHSSYSFVASRLVSGSYRYWPKGG